MKDRPEEFQIELFIQKDSDCCDDGRDPVYSTIPRRALVSETPASASSLQRLASWLQTCQSEHHLCNQSYETGQMPRRVLEVLSSTGEELLRLRALEKEKVAYTTLSHVWGRESDTPPLRTTKDNMETHKRSLCWDNLSKTFQDAVTTTRKLKIRYLWIDSLCIIQDDEKDWQEEAANMASIYTNSKLTLAAIGAPHGGVGFLSQTREVVKLQQASSSGIISKLTFFAQTFHCAHHIYRGEIRYHESLPILGKNIPLYRRGWCVQERYLSTRMVQYGKSEMIWQCKTALKCECLGDAPSNFLSFGSQFDAALRAASSPNDGIWLWESVVESFTCTQLSKRSDILPALSGLATIFQKFNWGEYIAGLWEQTIIHDLCWYRQRGKTSEEDRNFYTAPSFSWASSVGWATWDYEQSVDEDGSGSCPAPMCELIDFHTDTSVGIPLGEVTGGFVKLEGFLLPTASSTVVDTSETEVNIPSYTSKGVAFMDHSTTSGGPSSDIFCFPLRGYLLDTHSEGVHVLFFSTLLLERLSPCLYRRIGFLELETKDAVQSMPGEFFCGVRRQQITII